MSHEAEMAGPKRNRTAIVYHFFAHYRKGVLEELGRTENREFELVAARLDPWTSIKAVDVPPGLRFTETRLAKIRGQVMWQRGLLGLAARADLDSIIFLGNPYWPATWLAAVVARTLGKRVLFWTHGWRRRDKSPLRVIRNLFFRIPHGILLYGNQAKRVGMEQGFAPARLSVIYNSLDYEVQRQMRETVTESKSSRFLEACFRFPRRPAVVAVCRLTKGRRLELLLEALGILARRGRPVNLLLVGDGPERDSLRERANALRIEVAFLGECYEEDLLALVFMSSCATVIPAQLGLTCMHSLAYGTPVIANDDWEDNGPEVEAIVPGETGDRFRRGDVANLAERIEFWAANDHRREIVRRKCIQVIESSWCPKSQARRILRALEEAESSEGGVPSVEHHSPST